MGDTGWSLNRPHHSKNIVFKMTLSEIIASEAETDLEIPSEVEAPLPSAAKKKMKAKKSAKKSKKSKRAKKAKKYKKSKKSKKSRKSRRRVKKSKAAIRAIRRARRAKAKKSSWWSHTFSIR